MSTKKATIIKIKNLTINTGSVQNDDLEQFSEIADKINAAAQEPVTYTGVIKYLETSKEVILADAIAKTDGTNIIHLNFIAKKLDEAIQIIKQVHSLTNTAPAEQ